MRLRQRRRLRGRHRALVVAVREPLQLVRDGAQGPQVLRGGRDDRLRPRHTGRGILWRKRGEGATDGSSLKSLF